MAKGDYAVPENIRKMKPKGTCVKKIHGHFYVYEHFNKKDEDGKWHTVSGKLLGYIDPVAGFVSNENLLHSDEINCLNYGQYALVVNNSTSIIDRLLRFFNKKDAYRIYIMAILDVVNGYLPLKKKKTYYDQSYLSLIYSSFPFGEESLAELLKDLGMRQEKSLQFEESLINESSGDIAIDGHVVPSSSHENELAELGYKFNLIKDMQVNVLMGYDVNTNQPLFSRIYEGGLLDKVSVRDMLDRHEFKNVRFIVDRGFYSKENIELFSSNGNQYVIPLSPNLTSYKTVTADMNLNKAFVYEKSKKRTTVDYREDTVDGKRIIIFRDNNQYMIDKDKYLANMEINPGTYTQESYEKVKDYFGVIVLKTNIMDMPAKEIFSLYKKRWKIETYFNYVKNNIEYKAFHFEDYYMMQGMSFIILIEGLIYSELKKAVDEKVKGMSVDDCLDKAAFLKISKYKNVWLFNNTISKTVKLMESLNIDFNKEKQLINLK